MRANKGRAGSWAGWCAACALCAAAGGAWAQSSTTERYEFDSDASSVYWRVYKAGAFARFGHNHVVSVPSPSGSIVVDSDPAKSHFEFEFAVENLVVDDPELRARYGEEFASVPSAEDIAGTRRNMLSERVLDAEHFATVQVRGSGLTGFGDAQTIAIEIDLLGRKIMATVPIDIRAEDGAIDASGEFRLNHAELGMMPFSVMMGALAVGEELDFTYSIHAVRAD
jgi:hypothetical protein